ncbi:Secretory immunoglobulin A-binding protein EsiB [Pelomyxa schiedti]|nr:Secretory immunoglobulin A-binding protein EsiB [Pelomyxa schiedti]
MACLILAFLFMTDVNLFEPLMPCDVYLWDKLMGEVKEGEGFITDGHQNGNCGMITGGDSTSNSGDRVVVNFGRFLLSMMLGNFEFPFSDERKAKELIRMSADSGDPRAQTWYWQNYEKVDKYLQEAVEQRYPPALRELGIAYLDGTDCMAPNWEEGLRLLRMSAELSDVNAQNELASFLLHRADHVEQTTEDEQEAFKWAQLAARTGMKFAQEKLAGMYFRGIAVEWNVEEAMRLFKLSAAQGNTLAQVELGEIYFSGDHDGIPLDRELSAEYYSMAANGGDEAAQYHLAQCYIFGCGVEKDLLHAMSLLEQSSHGGYAKAYSELADVYTCGADFGIPQDYPKAAHLYKLGHKFGDAYATTALGRCYHQGKGVKPSHRKALKLFHKAAYSGHHVHTDIGRIYRASFSDEREASRWFRLAADEYFESTTPDLLESIDGFVAAHYREQISAFYDYDD